MIGRPALSVATLAALAAGIVLSHTASAGNAVAVVVLKEHGVGTSSAAQPYLNQFVASAAGLNGWDPASKGMYFTNRGQAETWMKAENPHYGIFSLPAFLALRKAYNLEIIGEAKTDSGGEQYFVATKTQGSLADCKGKRLATDHLSTADDQRFIEKVVAAGAFIKGDFTFVETRRFGEAGRKVLNGDADCALIHEAQLADMQKTSGGTVKSVWSSAKLPGMPVVAFPSAPGGEKSAFQTSLPKICPSNAGVCTAVGLLSLSTSSNSAYASVIASY